MLQETSEIYKQLVKANFGDCNSRVDNGYVADNSEEGSEQRSDSGQRATSWDSRDYMGSESEVDGKTEPRLANEPCAPNRSTLGLIRQEGVKRFVLMKNPNFEN